MIDADVVRRKSRLLAFMGLALTTAIRRTELPVGSMRLNERFWHHTAEMKNPIGQGSHRATCESVCAVKGWFSAGNHRRLSTAFGPAISATTKPDAPPPKATATLANFPTIQTVFFESSSSDAPRDATRRHESTSDRSATHVVLAAEA